MADDIEVAYEEYLKQQKFLPPATATPCSECPWRRVSWRGHLGPLSATEWVEKAHSDAAIECHLTVRQSGAEWNEVRQCRGAAIFRANVLKTPRNPLVVTGPQDREAVFASNQEFIEHHSIVDVTLKLVDE